VVAAPRALVPLEGAALPTCVWAFTKARQCFTVLWGLLQVFLSEDVNQPPVCTVALVTYHGVPPKIPKLSSLEQQGVITP
jgi:uncharacterized membrane protein